jgi:hypothetical protein
MWKTPPKSSTTDSASASTAAPEKSLDSNKNATSRQIKAQHDIEVSNSRQPNFDGIEWVHLFDSDRCKTMSLFSRLLNLSTGNIPLEDFFTELIAYLFTTDQEILTAWLKQLNLLDLPPMFDADVSTQREFKALKGHHLASRPDISIELRNRKRHSVVFIESKIGSHEGYNQLPRYLGHLEKLILAQKSAVETLEISLSTLNNKTIFSINLN